jgi:hypothetical protein
VARLTNMAASTAAILPTSITRRIRAGH